MTRSSFWLPACWLKAMGLASIAMSLTAQPYTARRSSAGGIPIVQLRDEAHRTVVSIVPSIGNNSYEMLVNGKNVFWFPFESLSDFAQKPSLAGNPLLAPWANRLDEPAFYANGKKYALNLELGNIRLDGNKLPIHGLLMFASEWEIVEASSDASSAWVTSRLDFSRFPERMAQFPFAHSIEMTYRLSAGVLEVQTRLTNDSIAGMPVSAGYHPYFQLHDAPRDEWAVSLGAGLEWVLNAKLTPTGQTTPVAGRFENPSRIPLRGIALDNVFGGLVRDAGGRARFAVKGKQEQIEVLYGPKYKVAVVYAPQGANRDFICFEPMSGVTNAFNLAHRGEYNEMAVIPSGESWQESYWIRPSGF